MQTGGRASSIHLAVRRSTAWRWWKQMAEALTQCWFTRVHLPERQRHRHDDGSTASTCRYCHQPIVSWDHRSWSLARGFDVSRLAATVSGRFLTLYDAASDFVLHRYSVAHLADEVAVEAFKQDLRAQYGMDDPHNTLELRDSAPPARPPRVSRAAPDMRRSA